MWKTSAFNGLTFRSDAGLCANRGKSSGHSNRLLERIAVPSAALNITMTDETPPEPTGRAKGRNNLHAFQPGYDPRRHARGPLQKAECGRTVASLARDKSADAFKVLVEIMEDAGAPPRDRIVAANSVIDRAIGKAKATISIEGTVQHEAVTIDPSKISVEVRRALLAARQELPAPSLIEDAAYTVAPSERPDE